MKNRTVKYYSDYTRTFRGEAVFLHFGIGYKIFGETSCMFSTAIIELPDGTIKNLPVQLIEFKKD